MNATEVLFAACYCYKLKEAKADLKKNKQFVDKTSRKPRVLPGLATTEGWQSTEILGVKTNTEGKAPEDLGPFRHRSYDTKIYGTADIAKPGRSTDPLGSTSPESSASSNAPIKEESHTPPPMESIPVVGSSQQRGRGGRARGRGGRGRAG